MSRKRDEESTASNTDLAQDSQLPEYDRLIGRKKLARQEEPPVLLRVSHSSLTPEFFAAAGMPSYPISSQKEMGVVLGPFGVEVVRDLLLRKLIKGTDSVMKGFDRWKPAKVQFPDLYNTFASADHTHTATQTASASGASFEETKTDPGPEISEEPSIPDVSRPVLSTAELVKEEDAPVRDTLDLESYVDSLPKPEPMVERLPDRPAAALPAARAVPAPKPPSSAAKPARREPEPVRAETRSEKSSFGLLAGGVLVAAAAIFAWKSVLDRPSPSVPLTTTATNAAANGATTGTPAVRKGLSEDNAGWPADLRPKTIEQLYIDNDDVNLRKVRKIVIAYQQNGAQVFSRDDELFLRRQAGEGASSPQAQLLAANHLAQHFVARRQEADAIRTLKSIVDYNPNDLATLINLAVSNYSIGNYADSIETTNVAMGYTLATSNPAVSWFANALHGLAVSKSAQPRKEDIDQDFRSVEQRNANNPLFYGLWIRALQSKSFKLVPKEDIRRLLMKALWADPDKLIDSSFEAVPLLRFWFTREAFEGLQQAAAMPEAKLKKGQRDFLDLLVKRRSPGVSLERIAATDVKEQLNRERVDDSLSQLLYGYMLKEEGSYPEAAQALASLLRDPSNRVESSYPVSLAGELAMETGNLDDAKLFFQQATERNRNDINALFGYVLMSRERGDYPEARAKLEQVVAGDPSFYPALLRMNRFVFQKRMFVRE